jgi:hypothetical protein
MHRLLLYSNPSPLVADPAVVGENSASIFEPSTHKKRARRPICFLERLIPNPDWM